MIDAEVQVFILRLYKCFTLTMPNMQNVQFSKWTSCMLSTPARMLLLNYSKPAENSASDMTKPNKPASVHMKPPERHSAQVPVHKLAAEQILGGCCWVMCVVSNCWNVNPSCSKVLLDTPTLKWLFVKCQTMHTPENQVSGKRLGKSTKLLLQWIIKFC